MPELSKTDWRCGGVLYQVYPRSFADSNGDGVGDLNGVTSRLDYLEWLGVDALWLNPIYPSPNVDWGYDVADYTAVHPDLGTLSDLDRLVAEAGRRGIGVLLDLVPNHTSIEHPWFRERPELYVWADEVPNNWRAVFGGGSAWTLDPERGRWYLHNFAREQPDLDWWSPQVRAEFERILRFWFDRGVAGFRIDVAHALVKDRELRDDVPATEEDDPHTRALGIRRIHSMNRPETHEILRAWRRLADAYQSPRVLVGEVYVLDVPAWARYYGSGSDELNLAFNFALVYADLDAGQMRRVVAATEAALPAGAWPCWIGSYHRVRRRTAPAADAALPTRKGWGAGGGGGAVVVAGSRGGQPGEVAVGGGGAHAAASSGAGDLVEGGPALAPGGGSVPVPAGPLVCAMPRPPAVA